MISCGLPELCCHEIALGSTQLQSFTVGLKVYRGTKLSPNPLTDGWLASAWWSVAGVTYGWRFEPLFAYEVMADCM